jgi:hypothetical protein
MTNLALYKKVLEPEVGQPEEVTNGVIAGYTGSKGYSHFPFPGTLTIDLEKIYPIKCIRFLLWDNLGKGGKLPNSRRYKYILGISADNYSWEEIYASTEEGTIGWQIFILTEIKQIRYIRIYGLHNTANERVHIVEIEAYDDMPADPPGYIGNKKEILFEQKSLSDSEEVNK